MNNFAVKQYILRNMDIESLVVERMQQVDNRIDIDESNLTPIQEFYKNTNIFVTGFTGFLGQILVEKLLRSCPVSKIFVLIRNKKDKDADTRIKEILSNSMFNRMKKACPNFRRKIVAVEGDCSLPELGLSDEDKMLLINEVHIILHLAATVRFDEELKLATFINVRATRDIAIMAQQMKNIKSFVQVSTAFCNCTNAITEEKIYPAPIPYNDLINIVDSVGESSMHTLESSLIGKYPNSYVYTKQIAEDAMKQESHGLPSGIYRPAVVISTYREPIRGWINNVYAATGVAYGAILGILRVFYADKNCTANMVPVDMCVNGLIASAWDVAMRYQKSECKKEDFEMPVYNYESSNDQKITWEEFKKYIVQYMSAAPNTSRKWVIFMYIVKSYPTYLLLEFFLHTVPAIIVDASLVLRGKQAQMMQVYRKIHKFSTLMHYFSVVSFVFKSENINTMLAGMCKKDLEVFFCNLKELDWSEFFSTYESGLRVYFLKDPLETIPEGKRHYRRLEWAHFALKTILWLSAITVLWFIFRYISS